MVVRIYWAAANQCVPFWASLRGAGPIKGAERDPCLRVVQRCRHVTLGKEMPTWTRGKDGTRVRDDNNTTETRNKGETRRAVDCATSANTLPALKHGRSKQPPGSRRSTPPERPRSINRAVFMTQANLRLVDVWVGTVGLPCCRRSARSFLKQSGRGFSIFSLSVIGRSHSLACLWARLCGPCLPCASGRALREQRGPAATCALWQHPQTTFT